MIAIIDYGVGNLFSIKNMLKKAGAESHIVNSECELCRADKIILPGIGAFDYCMSRLNESGLKDALIKIAGSAVVPILGICMGMQLMGKSSEEGELLGLGWLNAMAVRFNFNPRSSLKIPHMGWNSVQLKKESRLFKDMYPDPKFYFVHSYHMQCENPQDVLLASHYGYDFVCGIEQGNIFGVQFHPEKSHKYGMKLFENFIRL